MEVLESANTHPKFLSILGIKCDILLRKKLYQEALNAANEMEILILSIYGSKENYQYS